MASEPIWPLLKMGVTSKDVTAAQHLLTCRGYPTEITGTFDDNTASATSDFRDHVELPPGTEIDDDTWDYLTNFTLTQQNAPQKRECVRAAQVELIKQKAKPPLQVNGKFDDDMKMAVKHFQHRVKGDETGEVNPPTWKNLVGRKPPSP